LSLAGKTLANVSLEGQLRGQDFDRHPALEPLVPRPIHDAHAAAPDLAFYGVRITQRGGEPSGQRLVGGGGHERE
jgi:hypothetical protein